MKTYSVLTFILLASFKVSAAEPAVRTSLQLVACPDPTKQVLVYSKEGKEVAKLNALELVNKFQGWGDNEITVEKVQLARVQIPTHPELTDVYIDPDELATAESCKIHTDFKLAYESVLEDDDEEEDESAAPVLEAAAPQEVAKFSLDSEECCKFPLATRPKSFLSGIARFGAGRKKGRVHGGADLYGSRGQAVFSVTSGTVVRAPYAFKSGTLAVDIRHRGGFVVRYGEISGKSFGLTLGAEVKEGQQVGEMKYVPGAPAAMTHFELYKGNASGKLSQPGNNRYSRRGDIMNPTPYLIKWEKKK